MKYQASLLHVRALLQTRRVLLGLLCLVFWLIIKFILSHAVLSSFSDIFLTLQLDRKDQFALYYSAGGAANFSEKRLLISSDISAGAITTVHFSLNGNIARKLRLDPGELNSQVKLYRIKLESPYGPPISLDAQKIFTRFKPNDAITDYHIATDHLSFKIIGVDPQLILQDDLAIENRFVSLIFPFILTLVFFLLVSSFRWREFPAFNDLNCDFSSAHINYSALDGVRGLAVLMVLADHSLPMFTGAGTAGVWIFFVLSGFLLTIPFIDNPERGISVKYMCEYMVRRLKRIIPMYYVYVFVMFFVFGEFASDAVRHLLFLQGNGHLWTIQQEMLFYLMLPLIMAVNYLVFRGRVIWIIIGLSGLMLASNIWLGTNVILMHSLPSDYRPFAGIFICGMLFSYLYHGLILPSYIPLLISIKFKFWASLLGIVILLIFILLSTDTLFDHGYYPSQSVPGRFGVAAGIIILLALMTTGQLFSNLLSYKPLRAIGLVGYSFYLIHPAIITLVTQMWEYYLGYTLNLGSRFLIILILTYGICMLTYTFIERPFMKRSNQMN